MDFSHRQLHSKLKFFFEFLTDRTTFLVRIIFYNFLRKAIPEYLAPSTNPPSQFPLRPHPESHSDVLRYPTS